MLQTHSIIPADLHRCFRRQQGQKYFSFPFQIQPVFPLLYPVEETQTCCDGRCALLRLQLRSKDALTPLYECGFVPWHGIRVLDRVVTPYHSIVSRPCRDALARCECDQQYGSWTHFPRAIYRFPRAWNKMHTA